MIQTIGLQGLSSMNLWAEEMSTELNLVMDILFLLYYKPLCSCSFNHWKELFMTFQASLLFLCYAIILIFYINFGELAGIGIAPQIEVSLYPIKLFWECVWDWWYIIIFYLYVIIKWCYNRNCIHLIKVIFYSWICQNEG